MKLTNQVVFNKVWKHFVVNGNKLGKESDRTNKYFTSNENRCAVGCLLSKKNAKRLQNYAVEINDYGINSKKIIEKVISMGYDFYDWKFINHLQSNHDVTDNENSFKRDLEFLAEKFNLEIPSQ